jgi:hypothetical protein
MGCGGTTTLLIIIRGLKIEASLDSNACSVGFRSVENFKV